VIIGAVLGLAIALIAVRAKPPFKYTA